MPYPVQFRDFDVALTIQCPAITGGSTASVMLSRCGGVPRGVIRHR